MSEEVFDLDALSDEQAYELSRRLLENAPSHDEVRRAETFLRMKKEGTLAPRDGVDAQDLAQTGWGIVFFQKTDPAVQEALQPLVEWRHQQAAAIDERRSRVFRGKRKGEEAYLDGETPLEFVDKRGGAYGKVEPDRLPYYLLLFGTPQEIPFSFQFGLDFPYAVGRISFDTPEEYARYAQSVIDYEKAELTEDRPRRLEIFATKLPNDGPTQSSSKILLPHLEDHLTRRRPDWEVGMTTGHKAKKAALKNLLGEEAVPDLLFTVCHGKGINGTKDPLERVGAIHCQDRKCFFGKSLSKNANLQGLIAFIFGCYSAGLPSKDDFLSLRPVELPQEKVPVEYPDDPFIARLPQRLLGHAKGGALAVLAHVDRVYGLSFRGTSLTHQQESLEDVLHRLMRGDRIGFAKEVLMERYHQLLKEYDALRIISQRKGAVDPKRINAVGTAMMDMKNYLVLGDPAARIR